MSSGLAARLAAVPGVRSAIGDVSVPAELGDRAAVAHGWSSAALTPYVLSTGRPPAGPGEVVTGYPAMLGTRLTLAATEPARTVTVVGVARPRHIALLRAVAATPGQIRRMIAWEAAIIALVGSAAGIWPGIVLGRALAHGLMRHGIVPPNFTLDYDWLPAAAAIVGGVAAALLAVLAAGRRAARVPPTLALTDAAAEPRLLGPGRVIGGLLALAAAVPLFAISATTTAPDIAAATSELNAIFLVVAAAFLGPIVPYAVARLLAPPLAALSPVGGFLASANLGAATRRFSSASTPLVLTVALSCTLFFSTTTIDHATTQQRHAALTGQLALTSGTPCSPPSSPPATRPPRCSARSSFRPAGQRRRPRACRRWLSGIPDST